MIRMLLSDRDVFVVQSVIHESYGIFNNGVLLQWMALVTIHHRVSCLFLETEKQSGTTELFKIACMMLNWDGTVGHC